MTEREYTTAELMAVALSREFKGEEWGACGAFSQIPMAALRLAQLTHSPELTWMSGAGGAVNSQTKLINSSSDYRTHTGAEHIMTMEDIVDWELGGWRKKSQFGIFGGIQIDKQGSVNMAYLGPRDNYTLRGPGSVGLVFGTTFEKMYFYLHDHTSEMLCEEADFVSAPGHTENRDQNTPDHANGPVFGVTPMATLRFDDEMYAASIHPGLTPEEVASATGFDIEIQDQRTDPPTSEELEILRNEIDPDGLLQQMELD